MGLNAPAAIVFIIAINATYAEAEIGESWSAPTFNLGAPFLCSNQLF